MQVINNLTGRAAVIKRYAIPPFEPYRMRCLPDRHEQLSAQLHIVESIQIFYMLLGHYQNMGRRFGMDIIKGCGNFILPNQTFGFAVGDGTKKTIVHVFIIHGYKRHIGTKIRPTGAKGYDFENTLICYICQIYLTFPLMLREGINGNASLSIDREASWRASCRLGG